MVKFNRDLKTGDIFIHYHIAGKRFRASTGMRVSEKNWTGKWAKSSRVEYNGLTVNDELAHCQQCLVMAIVKLKAEGGGDIPRLKELYEIETTGKASSKGYGLKLFGVFQAGI